MMESIDKLFEDNFRTVCNSARLEAEVIFNENYLPHFIDLPLFEQISYLKAAQDQLEEDALKSLNPVFYDNHSTDEWLLKSFSSRAVILNMDESDDLFDAVLSGTLKYKLVTKYHELTKSIPPFTFNDFQENKYDRFYFESNYYHHLSEEDFYKIKYWQSDNLINIVTEESIQLIKQIQNSYADAQQSFIAIQNDIKLFDFLFDKADFNNPNELIAELKKFSFLDAYDFDQLNNADALTDFHSIVKNETAFKRITPAFVESQRDKYNAIFKRIPFSSSPIIFFTIIRVIGWFKKVIEYKNFNTAYIIPDYPGLYKLTYDKAVKESDDLINKFEKSYNFNNLSKDEIIDLLTDKLHDLRIEYNQDGFYRYYFDGLHNMGEELVKAFKINSFFNSDDQINIDSLKKAVILYEQIWYYLDSIYEITVKKYLDDENSSGGFTEILFLLHNMVLDADLYNKMKFALDKSMNEFHQSGLPFDLIRFNLVEELESIFSEGLDRMNIYLENCESNNKILFVYSRLKQLKLRKLSLNLHKRKYKNFNTGIYTSFFTEFLELQADYIRETKDINIIPSLAINSNLKLADPSKIQSLSPPIIKQNKKSSFKSFYLNDFDSKIDKLKSVFIALIDKKYLQANKDSDEDFNTFKNIFSGKEISIPVIWSSDIQYLSSFIKGLTKNKQLIDLYFGKWDIAINCFIRPDGSSFTLDQLMHPNSNPKEDHNINSICKLLF